MSEWIVKQNTDGQLEVVGELIRCKDCHWYIESEVFKGKDCTHFSGLTYPSPDDYCSRAERKEE